MTSENTAAPPDVVADAVNGGALDEPLDDNAAEAVLARHRRAVASVEHVTFSAFISDDPEIDVHVDSTGGPGLVCNIGRAVTLFANPVGLAAIRDAIDAHLGRPAQVGDEVLVCGCCRGQLAEDDVALRLYVERIGFSLDAPTEHPDVVEYLDECAANGEAPEHDGATVAT